MNRIVILGATGTIGRTVAHRLARKGLNLLLIGRQKSKLAQIADELDQPHVECDFGASNNLDEVLERAAEHTGGYSGFVNCIGSLLLKPAHLTSDEEFRRVVETNLFTAFVTVRAGAKYLRQQGGSIVLFASAAAEIGIQHHEAIAAAKAGVIGLARSAAATYAPRNIRVNAVSPGLVRTELTRSLWENENAAAASTDLHALHRLGEPEQVASLVDWLLDPENDWITGQVIGIDGGLGHILPRRRSPS